MAKILKTEHITNGVRYIVRVAAELICQKIDGLICHGQPN